MHKTQSSYPAQFSRYITFDREQWKTLRACTPLLLTEHDLYSLRGVNEQVSLKEVGDVYVPLSRLLNLNVAAVQHLYQARREFLGETTPLKVPYIIGIVGSVAVGKSTFARVLRTSLARWPDHPEVEFSHHRRLPISECHLAGTRFDGAKRLSGELRSAPATAIPGGTSRLACR